MANRTDAALGVAFLAIAGVVYVLSRGMPTGTMEEGMGSAFFPGALSAALAALSLMLALSGIFGKKKRAGGAEDGGGEEPALSGLRLRTPAVLTAATAAYLALVEAAGFLLATPLFILAVMRIFSAAWLRAAVAGVAVTAGLYVIFGMGLRIPFPAGQLLGR